MNPQPPQTLRQRKKAKAKAAIQAHAMRLFIEHGYDQTTIERIAEAAEVSPSTFFRYFPTKEAVVLFDAMDPLIVHAFMSQPTEVNPIEAIRKTIRQVFSAISEEQLQQELKRAELMHEVPALRAAMLGEFARNIDALSALIATRKGQSRDDVAVRVLAGAIIGAIMSALLKAYEEPQADYLRYYDEALEQLEKVYHSE